MISDARGQKFLLKFDSPQFPEQETATHVIVGIPARLGPDGLMTMAREVAEPLRSAIGWARPPGSAWSRSSPRARWPNEPSPCTGKSFESAHGVDVSRWPRDQR